MGIARDRWALVERLYHAAVMRSMAERAAFFWSKPAPATTRCGRRFDSWLA
jgi:hypothetical protein